MEMITYNFKLGENNLVIVLNEEDIHSSKWTWIYDHIERFKSLVCLLNNDNSEADT